MLGFQDLNANLEYDEGEPAGAYPQFVNLAAGENVLGATIKMQPLTINSNGQSEHAFDNATDIAINKLLNQEE